MARYRVPAVAALLSGLAAFQPASDSRAGAEGRDSAKPASSEHAVESRAFDLESIIWTAIASSGRAMTSVDLVECTELECEIRVTGVDDSEAFNRALFTAGWDRERGGWPLFKQGGYGQVPLKSGHYVWRISTRCPSRELYLGPEYLDAPAG
jgi:hypothetical protein